MVEMYKALSFHQGDSEKKMDINEPHAENGGQPPFPWLGCTPKFQHQVYMFVGPTWGCGVQQIGSMEF